MRAHSESLCEAIIAKLGNTDEKVRQPAMLALVEMGKPAVEPLLAVLHPTRPPLWLDLFTGRSRSWPAAVARASAVQCLGRIGDIRAVKPLITVLHDSDWTVRQHAAEALGRLSDPSAVEPLINALSDSVWTVRQTAAEALGQLGDVRAVELLSYALRDSEWPVREQAAHALGNLCEARATKPLARALRDRCWKVSDAAVYALSRIGTRRANIALLRRSWYLIMAAITLGILGWSVDSWFVGLAAATLLGAVFGVSGGLLSKWGTRYGVFWMTLQPMLGANLARTGSESATSGFVGGMFGLFMLAIFTGRMPGRKTIWGIIATIALAFIGLSTLPLIVDLPEPIIRIVQFLRGESGIFVWTVGLPLFWLVLSWRSEPPAWRLTTQVKNETIMCACAGAIGAVLGMALVLILTYLVQTFIR